MSEKNSKSAKVVIDKILASPAIYDKIGEYLVHQAGLHANFNAGRPTTLAKKLRYEKNEAKHTVTLICDAAHAAAQEFGSEPHIIRPKNGKALHWVHSGAKGNVTLANGSQIKTGDDVFAGEVHHPGNAAAPFMRPAIQDLQRDIKKVIK